MPGSFKTEAVVLRSIRYGEADRVLHLYTAARGRIGAIAKGSRKPRSRFGGRLEPFFRLDMVLHEGRGDLATVTGVHTVDGYPESALVRPGACRGGAGMRRGASAARLLGGESGGLQPALPVSGAARRPGDGGEGMRRATPMAPRAWRRRLRSGSSWRSSAGFAPELTALRSLRRGGWADARSRAPRAASCVARASATALRSRRRLTGSCSTRWAGRSRRRRWRRMGRFAWPSGRLRRRSSITLTCSLRARCITRRSSHPSSS